MSPADRRRRAEEALASRYCETCGWSWWAVSPRGDAWCHPCAELLAGRAPRCGTCQRTDGWATAGNQKRCETCAPPPRPARQAVDPALAAIAAALFASREARP